MPKTKSPPPSKPRSSRSFEIITGACVLLISLISLFVAASANRTQERMLAASVWPSLIFGTSNVSLEGAPQITLDLLNRGIGPARVRWAEMLYDGEPVRDSDTLLSLCCEQPQSSLDRGQVITSGIQRRVIGADEWITVLRIPKPDPSTAAWERLNQERHKIRLRACYCSVLDDCWLLDSDDDEPAPVPQCPRPPAVLWDG